MAKKGSFFRGSLQEHWWPGQRLWAGCPPRVGSAPGDGAITHGGDGDVRVPMPPRRACVSHAGGSLRVPGGPRCGWPSTPGPRAAHSVALGRCSVLTEMTACDSVTLGSLGGWLLPFPMLNCRKMTRFFQYKRFKTRVRNPFKKAPWRSVTRRAAGSPRGTLRPCASTVRPAPWDPALPASLCTGLGWAPAVSGAITRPPPRPGGHPLPARPLLPVALCPREVLAFPCRPSASPGAPPLGVPRPHLPSTCPCPTRLSPFSPFASHTRTRRDRHRENGWPFLTGSSFLEKPFFLISSFTPSPFPALLRKNLKSLLFRETFPSLPGESRPFLSLFLPQSLVPFLLRKRMPLF